MEQVSIKDAEKLSKKSIILRFFSYFWGPIPWMIEIAAILSLLVKHWTDFFVIFALLLFNAGIGFWQEMKASNALDALKAQLALKAKVLRDGKWVEIEAREIVPGDMVRIKIGDIIPADLKLLDGDYVSVDQAALMLLPPPGPIPILAKQPAWFPRLALLPIFKKLLSILAIT